MDLGLKDRVAIVGGASRGLGLAIASAFAREGASVTISARTEADLQARGNRTCPPGLPTACAGRSCRPFSSQGHSPGGAGYLQPVRPNRNIGYPCSRQAIGPTSEFDDETMMASLESSLLNCVRIAREVIPYMKQQRWGRIIHLLPHWGSHPAIGANLSSAGQLALVGHSKALANELASFNITVNNVISGPIQTDYLTSVLEDRARHQGREMDELVSEVTRSHSHGPVW